MTITNDDILSKLVAPLLVALVAWLLKDVVVGLMKARQEEARNEWLFQLREVYGPLHFWSAVALFKGSTGTNKFGVAEFSAALARAITLLPTKQYYVFVKILEEATGQGTTKASKVDILQARDFVYSRIEALNFVLFKMPPNFNLQSKANPFASLRSSWRLAMSALVPLLIWMCIAAFLAGLYWLMAARPLALMMLGALIVLLVVQEIRERTQQYKTIKSRLGS